MKKVVAGVDIGGTNTVFGIVDTEGKVLAEGHFKTTDYPDVKDFVKALGAGGEETTGRKEGSRAAGKRNRSSGGKLSPGELLNTLPTCYGKESFRLATL